MLECKRGKYGKCGGRASVEILKHDVIGKIMQLKTRLKPRLKQKEKKKRGTRAFSRGEAILSKRETNWKSTATSGEHHEEKLP